VPIHGSSCTNSLFLICGILPHREVQILVAQALLYDCHPQSECANVLDTRSDGTTKEAGDYGSTETNSGMISFMPFMMNWMEIAMTSKPISLVTTFLPPSFTRA
jgi:hypothetical protein